MVQHCLQAECAAPVPLALDLQPAQPYHMKTAMSTKGHLELWQLYVRAVKAEKAGEGSVRVKDLYKWNPTSRSRSAPAPTAGLRRTLVSSPTPPRPIPAPHPGRSWLVGCRRCGRDRQSDRCDRP